MRVVLLRTTGLLASLHQIAGQINRELLPTAWSPPARFEHILLDGRIVSCQLVTGYPRYVLYQECPPGGPLS